MAVIAWVLRILSYDKTTQTKKKYYDNTTTRLRQPPLPDKAFLAILQ